MDGPSYHSVHRQQLVAPFQPPLPVCHPAGDHSGDVDGGVLLLAPHDVEAQALLCLGELHYPRVGMPLAGRERCHCGLGKEEEKRGRETEVSKRETERMTVRIIIFAFLRN